MPKVPDTDFTTPAIVGVYAMAGVFIVRALKGATTPVAFPVLAVVAGTAAASSAVASRVLPAVVCPKSDIAPLAQAAIATGLSWVALNVLADMDTATTMVPVTLTSDVLGNYAASLVLKQGPAEKKNHHSKEKAEPSLATDESDTPNLAEVSSMVE
jgi:hypothetical protein